MHDITTRLSPEQKLMWWLVSLFRKDGLSVYNRYTTQYTDYMRHAIQGTYPVLVLY